MDFNGRFIQTAGAVVLANGPLEADRLEIQGGSFFTASNLLVPATAEVANARYLGGVASTLSLEGTTIYFGPFQFASPGTDLTIGDATAFDGFYTDGTIRVGDKTLTILSAGYANLGVLTDLDGGTLVAANGIALGGGDNLTGTGTVEANIAAAAGSVIQATGDLSLGNPASPAGFHGDGELRVGTGIVTINDTNQARLGTLVTLGSGSTPGTLNVTNGAAIDFDQAVIGTGTINSTNTPATAVINNGAITGNSPAEPITLTGYVKGVGTLDNVVITGTDAPGFSPATVNRGSVVYDGTLEIEIGGDSPGSFDQINHILGAGVANLGGMLDVALINGFMPSLHDSFEIITATGGVNGMFSTPADDLPTLSPGLEWAIDYGDNNVVLSVNRRGPGGRLQRQRHHRRGRLYDVARCARRRQHHARERLHARHGR